MIKVFFILISSLLWAEAQKFPGKEAISASDWALVQSMNTKAQMELLKQYQNLADWHWSWRILWVKICAERPAEPCQKLLHSALSDAALVVRSEAVRRISEQKLKDSEKAKWIQAFKEAFKNPANYRGDKPLYIQEQILKSLLDLGENQESLLKLASTHSELRAFILSRAL
jgi:hypothetical protein